MKRALIKTGLIVAALGVLGWLFVRSASDVRSEPYEIARARLAASGCCTSSDVRWWSTKGKW